MKASAFRKLVMSLTDVEAKPHFARTAFRTPARIFATMGASEEDVNLKLDVDTQLAVTSASKAFSKIPNKWGDQGWTQCILAKVSEEEMKTALTYAHGLASEKKVAQKKRLLRQ